MESHIVDKAEEDSLKELDWISSSEEFERTILQNGIRKMKENPFVPIGTILTIGALTNGLRSFLQGDSVKSQRMMRYRVGFQGATIFACVAGILYYDKKNKS